MNVHESLSDWRSLPMSMLDGHRAIIQLNEGMIIDGYEKLLNEGWQILRVDTMPTTELRDNAVTATNVYILEREANDD